MGQSCLKQDVWSLVTPSKNEVINFHPISYQFDGFYNFYIEN